MCFFFKHETADEMRMSDWSSDVCSSDLPVRAFDDSRQLISEFGEDIATGDMPPLFVIGGSGEAELVNYRVQGRYMIVDRLFERGELRSEEHTSELQSLMRISYAVFCLKNKITNDHSFTHTYTFIHVTKPSNRPSFACSQLQSVTR